MPATYPKRISRPRISKETKERAVDFIKEGRRYADILAQLPDIHHFSTLRAIAKQYGLPPRVGSDRSGSNRKQREKEKVPRKLRSKLRAEALRLRALGMGEEAIAAEIGQITRQGVAWLIKNSDEKFSR